MKTKKIILLLLSVVFILALVNPVFSVEIKIGSVAPKRSPWDKGLRKVAREIRQATNGQVTIKVYASEYFGNERTVVKKMREGKLGGALITAIGLSHIYKDTFVLLKPLLFNNSEEFNYVLGKMKPFFEERIEKEGFRLISWILSGWVYFFSKKPVFYPEDLKNQKLVALVENPKVEKVFRDVGFQVVSTNLKKLAMILQSGEVDAFFASPLVTALAQHFTFAPNMCNLRVAPLHGSVIITTKAWRAIPDRYKSRVLQIAERLTIDLYNEAMKLEEEAIEEMEKEGLIINRVPADAREKWRDIFEKGMKPLIEELSSREVYDQIQKYLKEYREMNIKKR